MSDPFDGPRFRCMNCGGEMQMAVPPPLPFDDFDSPVRQLDFDAPRQQQPRPTFYVPDKKSAGVAAVMSFFWPGLGQIYNGQIGKALLFMFVWPSVYWAFVYAIAMNVSRGPSQTREGLSAASLVIIVAGIGWIASLVWNIYDAHSEAERINLRHRRQYG